jgi:hypothetical protein
LLEEAAPVELWVEFSLELPVLPAAVFASLPEGVPAPGFPPVDIELRDPVELDSDPRVPAVTEDT